MIFSTIYKSMKNTDVNIPFIPKFSHILGVINQLHYNWEFINISSGKTFTFQGGTDISLLFHALISKNYMPCLFFFWAARFSQRVYSGRPGNREVLHLKDIGPLGGEAWLVLATKVPVGQQEPNLEIVEQLYHLTTSLTGRDLLYLHDLVLVGAGMVPGPHVSVAQGDGASSGQVLVFPVPVVGATAGVIAQPDARVLHPQGGFISQTPAHSRQFPLKISSSSTETQSTRSETWQQHG